MAELVHLKGYGSWSRVNGEWAIMLKINGSRPASTYVGQMIQVRKKGQKFGEWQLLGKVLKEHVDNWVEFAKGGAEGGD